MRSRRPTSGPGSLRHPGSLSGSTRSPTTHHTPTATGMEAYILETDNLGDHVSAATRTWQLKQSGEVFSGNLNCSEDRTVE